MLSKCSQSMIKIRWRHQKSNPLKLVIIFTKGLFFSPKPAARVHKKLIPTFSIAVVQNCISLKINVYLFKRECNILQNKAKKIWKDHTEIVS